ncbi:inner membrane protein import complex subunit Tim54-domain-containing protein [Irpex lacteus]|nr:inner membrane protein import complex subunit Tim54-domain-containing protein [Irpex lacteus]
MTTNGGDSSGIKTVLQYTGIPPSWLDKRPKLPSRNWLIFLSVTSAITGYYLYDRKQCKEIRQEYVEKVKHLSKVPLPSMALPRKVTVYGCKWPNDEDYDRSLKYFRKYVKPILGAAAIDYEMINGRRHGDLADRIASDIKKLRRIQAGIDPPPPNPMNLPTSTVEAKRQRELEGGIVIVGRPAFKEFMAGGSEKVDKEEQLARLWRTTPVNTGPSKPFSPFTPPYLSSVQASTSSSSREAIPSNLNSPPSTLPPQPPIYLVSFVDYMTRPMTGRISEPLTPVPGDDFSGTEPTPAHGYQADESIAPNPPTDLDFDKDVEGYYKKSFVKSFSSDIEKARANYYSELTKKLETARALPVEEQNYPPPTEVELRAERMKKELRWRSDERAEREAQFRAEAEAIWEREREKEKAREQEAKDE